MNPNLIYYPCLVLILWTFLVMLRMFICRVQVVRTGQINIRYFKTYNTGENLPPLAVQASRNFSNLLEMPPLFYVLCAFALITQSVDHWLLGLAWSYVGLRIVHSVIHITINKIMPRMSIFALSCGVLFIMAFRIGLMIHH
jgi:hypothetical protein